MGTVCVQELVQLSARIGKSNATEPSTTMEIFTRAVRDKMSATQKLKIQMEYSVQVSLILMDAHTHAHPKKYCVLPKKDLLDVKKRPNV